MAEKMDVRYRVVPYTGKTERKTFKYEKGKGFVSETVEDEGGFLVFFPAGHAIRVRSESELSRLGFDMPAPLIDEENEIVSSVAAARANRNSTKRGG